MKNTLLFVAILLSTSLLPATNFAQNPALGSTYNFSLFTAAGAFNNLGASNIVGDIGTQVGAFTGFPPGTVVGGIHVADPVATQAAIDLEVLNADLVGRTCGQVLTTTLGNGQSLLPNVYCIGAATTLDGNLILDAQGDPNSLFIFQIDAAFTTGLNSNIVLLNGACICNVFWQVNGNFTLGNGAQFKGTIVANGAISLLEASSLMGRGLSRAGIIATNNNIVMLPTAPLAIKITELNAINKGDANIVSWETSNARLGDIFELERSSNGLDFYKIAELPANGQLTAYSFVDDMPLSTLNHYRLLLREVSGVIAYSKVVTANYQSKTNIQVQATPNPAGNMVHIVIQGKMAAHPILLLSDISGKPLRSLEVINKKMQVSLVGLVSGMYLIQYLDIDQTTIIKIIKQ